MRHLDNFASLAACLCWSLTLPPHTPDDRSHRHSPGASSLCRQITLHPPSVDIITVAPYTLASPPSSSHPALSATSRRRATLTHGIPRHSQIRLPLPSTLSAYSPTSSGSVGIAHRKADTSQLYSASRFYCSTTTHRPCFAQRKEG